MSASDGAEMLIHCDQRLLLVQLCCFLCQPSQAASIDNIAVICHCQQTEVLS